LRGSFFLRLEDFGGKLAAFFPGKLRQIEAEPLPDPESWRHVFWFSCHNVTRYHIVTVTTVTRMKPGF
jgi:hypothetical protein